MFHFCVRTGQPNRGNWSHGRPWQDHCPGFMALVTWVKFSLKFQILTSSISSTLGTEGPVHLRGRLTKDCASWTQRIFVFENLGFTSLPSQQSRWDTHYWLSTKTLLSKEAWAQGSEAQRAEATAHHWKSGPLQHTATHCDTLQHTHMDMGSDAKWSQKRKKRLRCACLILLVLLQFLKKWALPRYMCVCMCGACVRACMCVCVHACVRVCVCLHVPVWFDWSVIHLSLIHVMGWPRWEGSLKS